jgi:FtsZ-binding cell division protein ZapB
MKLFPGDRERGNRWGRAVLVTFLLAAAVGVLSPAAMSGDDDGAPKADKPKADEPKAAKVDDVRDVLEKWVETRRVISKERRDWTLGREMVEDRIRLVQREIESLRARIGDAEKSIADADRKRADLVETNEKLKSASSALGHTVGALETRTRELLKRLPDPIRERVKPLSQRIPEKPEETKLSLSERFQNVVGLLNEVNKFNRDVTVTSEVRKLDNGTTVEVTALYVGIGQGYYVTAKGDAAGVGVPSAEGWVWTPANDAAARIAEAIAILKNEKAAEFVRLPVRIQ